MFWLLLICIIIVLGFFISANFRCYTAYTFDSADAWKQWERWKKIMEANNFEIELVDVSSHGTYIDFYYKMKKKKPQK